MGTFMNIAIAVRTVAQAKDMTQADICKASGLSDSYMSQLFSGKIPDPKTSTIYKVCTALGVTVDYLLELAYKDD